MTRDEAMAFAAIRSTRTPAEIKAFSAALIADHDAIVTYPDLVAKFHNLPKEERKAIYAQLEKETAKYPRGCVFEDALFGRAFLSLRAKMEFFRGVKRDVRGEIILTDDERRERIAAFKAKIEEVLGPSPDLSKTWGPWVEACKAEIALQEDYLAGRRKTHGSIWDFINSDVESPNQLIKAEG